MTKDLTKGNPTKIILAFALPMVLGTLFQQLYNMVDSIVVGNFVGSTALAAVGCSWPIIFMAIAVSSGLSSGTAIVAGQLFGAGKTHKIHSVFTTMLLFSAGVSVVITVLGAFFAEPILAAMHTPADILAEGVVYLRIYFYGFLFLFTYNMQAAVFNALGDSRTPLYFLVISSALNIGLDLLFVISFSMGVAGVAYATLISQAVSAVLAFFVLRARLKKLAAQAAKEERGRVFDTALLKAALKMGLPAAIGTFSVSFTSLLIQSLLNTFGSVYIAGFTGANKIDNLIRMPIMNIGMAVQSYTAQNIGAGRIDRAKQGFRSGNLISGAFCVLMSVLIFFASPTWMGFFLDSAKYPQEIAAGAYYLTHIAPLFLAMSFLFVTEGLLKGAGDMNYVTGITFLGMGARLGVAYGMAALIGYDAIWLSSCISWVVEAVLSVARYYGGKWQAKAVIMQKTHNK